MERIEAWKRERASAVSFLASLEAGTIKTFDGEGPECINERDTTAEAATRWKVRVAMLDRLIEREENHVQCN